MAHLPGDRAGEPKTIAVLPFKDLSGRNDPTLADGVAEEIMGRLSRDPGQKVIGRTSSWSFADQRLDASQIGRRLNVDYLVEGSVRSAQNQFGSTSRWCRRAMAPGCGPKNSPAR